MPRTRRGMTPSSHSNTLRRPLLVKDGAGVGTGLRVPVAAHTAHCTVANVPAIPGTPQPADDLRARVPKFYGGLGDGQGAGNFTPSLSWRSLNRPPRRQTNPRREVALTLESSALPLPSSVGSAVPSVTFCELLRQRVLLRLRELSPSQALNTQARRSTWAPH